MLDGSELIGLALGDFGATALVDRGPETIKGLFSTEAREVVKNGITVWNDDPVLSVRAADAAEIVRNYTVLEIAEVEYQVFNSTPAVEPGWVDLYLTRSF